MAKYKRSAIGHLLWKASADKVKEEKWIQKLHLHRAYLLHWGHVDSWYWITSKTFKHFVKQSRANDL